MRRALIIAIILIIIIPLPFMCSGSDSDIERVCFTPGCEQYIIDYLDRAKTEIKIQAYSFTSAPIARALLSAKNRGVSVDVILDKSQETSQYSAINFFKNNEIPVHIDGDHAIAHNKIIIIDKVIVITGSYNFTRAAEERNAENVVIIRSEEIAGQYLDNWHIHRQHSR